MNSGEEPVMEVTVSVQRPLLIRLSGSSEDEPTQVGVEDSVGSHHEHKRRSRAVSGHGEGLRTGWIVAIYRDRGSCAMFNAVGL